MEFLMCLDVPFGTSKDGAYMGAYTWAQMHFILEMIWTLTNVALFQVLSWAYVGGLHRCLCYEGSI